VIVGRAPGLVFKYHQQIAIEVVESSGKEEDIHFIYMY
jgi:hypothetical protein